MVCWTVCCAMCALYPWSVVTALVLFILRRKSKQPLMAALPLPSSSAHDGAMPSDVPSHAGAQLWLLAPNSVTRKIVRDYLTEVRPALSIFAVFITLPNTNFVAQSVFRCFKLSFSSWFECHVFCLVTAVVT